MNSLPVIRLHVLDWLPAPTHLPLATTCRDSQIRKRCSNPPHRDAMHVLYGDQAVQLAAINSLWLGWHVFDVFMKRMIRELGSYVMPFCFEMWMPPSALCVHVIHENIWRYTLRNFMKINYRKNYWTERFVIQIKVKKYFIESLVVQHRQVWMLSS